MSIVPVGGARIIIFAPWINNFISILTYKRVALHSNTHLRIQAMCMREREREGEEKKVNINASIAYMYIYYEH